MVVLSITCFLWGLAGDDTRGQVDGGVVHLLQVTGIHIHYEDQMSTDPRACSYCRAENECGVKRLLSHSAVVRH